MSRGRSIQYQAPAVPKFLQQFKQKTGYKEGPIIGDKFADSDQPCVDSDPDRSDDDGPVVVVLKPGDLTKEEADTITGKKRKIDDSDDEDDDDGSGRIKFRKPKKKKKESTDDGAKGKDENSTAKKDGGSTKKEKVKKKRPANGPKNLSLLSFGEDEDR